jgi:hypothetical protein
VSGVRERWVRGGRIEAETARSALAFRDIESRLVGEDAGGEGFPLSLEHQGMEVHVAPNDLGPARQLLEPDEKPSDTNPMSRTAITFITAAVVAVAVLVALSAVG